MDFNSIFDQMEKERQKAFDIKKDSKKDEPSPKKDVDAEDEEIRQESDEEHKEDEQESENSEKHDDESETEKQKETEDESETVEEIHEESTEETTERADASDSDSEGNSKEDDAENTEDIKDPESTEDKTEQADEPKKDLADHLNYPSSNAQAENVRNDSVQEEIQQVKQIITKTESREIKNDSAENEDVKDEDNKKDIQSKPKKDVIPMPEKTEKIIKTTVTVKKTKSASTAPKPVKAKAVKVKPVKKQQPKKAKIIHLKTVKIVKIKPTIKKITHHKKTIIKQIPKSHLRKLSSLQDGLKKLKASISQAAKRERSFQKKDLANNEKKKLDQEIVRIKKEIDHLKEFQPDTLLNSIQRLNENIAEMNSLFKLSTELMQKSDPIDSKLKQLSDENEKIAQGILTVLDAVNDLKEGKKQEIDELNKIEDEIKLPLRNIASRADADYSPPSIPTPPPEFMDSLFPSSSEGIPAPPSMTPMPPSEPSDIPPTPIQAPNVMPIPRPQQRPLTGGPLPKGFDMPPSFGSSGPNNVTPVSSTNFSADDLDRFASQIPGPQMPRQVPMQKSVGRRQSRTDLKI